MSKQKQNMKTTITKTDRVLFISGGVAITLLGIYFANILFSGHIAILLVEVALYITILGMFFGIFRSSSPSQSSVMLARTISYVSIGGTILTAAFVVYFLTTFRW